MHIVSIGDSIFIWDVLAWTTPRPGLLNNTQCIVPSKIHERVPILSNLDNNGQPRNPPEPFQYTQQMNGHTARAIPRSLSNSELNNKNISVSQGQKKINNKKLLTKQIDNIPTIRRHFIQRINHSQLAKDKWR
ncbi:unnamed protein product [Rotaria sp. Silwood2]|nr:unnamed protein product [Rotaria sp. Silwood2]